MHCFHDNKTWWHTLSFISTMNLYVFMNSMVDFMLLTIWGSYTEFSSWLPGHAHVAGYLTAAPVTTPTAPVFQRCTGIFIQRTRSGLSDNHQGFDWQANTIEIQKYESL